MCVLVSEEHIFGVNSFKKGFEDVWSDNKCVMLHSGPFGNFDCNAPPMMANNSVVIPPGAVPENVCGKSPSQQGVASMANWPKAGDVVAWGRQVLRM